jgi:nucleoside phosphorylase
MELAEKLALETGKVTTGSSLDLQPCDEVIIEREGGELKDMEGAAVAFVCSLTGVPVMLVKSVTDLCDDSAPTLEAFLKNLHLASKRLAEVNRKAVELLLS